MTSVQSTVMNTKGFFTVNRVKFNFLLIIFNILLCIPFSVFYDLFSIYVELPVILFSALYIIWESDFTKNRNYFLIFIATLLIIIAYSSLYIGEGLGSPHGLIVQVVHLVFMLAIYLYISTEDRIKVGNHLFSTLIVFISILTIISFIGANTGLIRFEPRNLAGYDIRFNYILGGVSLKWFYRPQYYFDEPSYLGFFLGFAFFYLKEASWIKHKSIKLLIIFIAGVLVLSVTFYATFLIGFFSEFLIVKITPFISNRNLSKIYLVVFIILSTVLISKLSEVHMLFFSGYSNSFLNRMTRIEISLETLHKMSFFQLLTGNGTGFIALDISRILGASNSYIKTLVNNGLIILIVYLFIIYNFLKDHPTLLLYTLVGLSSVVILETPFLLFIIVLSKTMNHLQVSDEKFAI